MNNVKHTCIYLLTSTDGDTYIGKTSDLKRRVTNHKSTYMKNKQFTVTVLQTIENTISCFCSQEELYWQYKLKPTLNKGVIVQDSRGQFCLNKGVPKKKNVRGGDRSNKEDN